MWSPPYHRSIFKRYRSDRHFSEFLPTRWRQKLTGIDLEQKVSPLLCIVRSLVVKTFLFFNFSIKHVLCFYSLIFSYIFFWAFIYVKTHRTLNAKWQSVVAVLIIKIYYCSCAFEFHLSTVNRLDLRPPITSVLWRCWLGGKKGIRPVKNWVVGCWRGYLSGLRCRYICQPYVIHYATLIQYFDRNS